jgi:hypothetical protein
MIQADAGISELRQYVDALVVIPNERLKQVSDTRITLANAFEAADDVLRRGVQSISELINVPGFINLDFADVTTMRKDAGYAHMGVGSAKGSDKARLAATMAISSPLLSTSIAGATGVLISITYSPDTTIDDIDEASMMIHDEAHPDANIIWGASSDETLEDEIRITIIATGFNNQNELIESTKRSSVQGTIAGNSDAAYTPAESAGFGASMTAEECAARYFGNMASNANSANSDIEAPVSNAAPAVETTPEIVADTDNYIADTIAVSDAVVADSVKVENTEKPAASANAQASYQEYDELFKCIKRIKKN